jgi:hypothetical protein
VLLIAAIAAEDALPPDLASTYLGLAAVSFIVLGFSLAYLATARGQEPFWIFGLLYGGPSIVGAIGLSVDEGVEAFVLATLVGLALMAAAIVGGALGRRHLRFVGDALPSDDRVTFALVLGLLGIPTFNFVVPSGFAVLLGYRALRRDPQPTRVERVLIVVGLAAGLLGLGAAFASYATPC